MNTVALIGRLGSDPQLWETPSNLRRVRKEDSR